MPPLLGTWPATQACAPIGNRLGTFLLAGQRSIHWATPARANTKTWCWKYYLLLDIFWWKMLYVTTKHFDRQIHLLEAVSLWRDSCCECTSERVLLKGRKERRKDREVEIWKANANPEDPGFEESWMTGHTLFFESSSPPPNMEHWYLFI